jgi:hypothetical protein
MAGANAGGLVAGGILPEDVKDRGSFKESSGQGARSVNFVGRGVRREPIQAQRCNDALPECANLFPEGLDLVGGGFHGLLGVGQRLNQPGAFNLGFALAVLECPEDFAQRVAAAGGIIGEGQEVLTCFAQKLDLFGFAHVFVWLLSLI